jgi:hypothetical protein
VSATLGKNLILQDHCGRTGVFELVHRSNDVVFVAVAIVGIDYQWDIDASADVLRDEGGLDQARQPNVWIAQETCGDAIAAHEYRRKSGSLKHHCTQDVVATGQFDAFGPGE